MRKFAIAFGFYILTCSTGWAATHYVNNSGSPTCANSGSGTLAAPWCSLNYGIAHISGGDTLFVRTGTYNEELDITGPAGSAALPTTISAYPGDAPILLGNGINTGRIKIELTSYMTFSGFEVTNFNQGIFVETASNIIVSNCVVHNIGQEGVHVHYGSSYVTLTGNTVHDTGQWTANGEGFYIGTGDSTPVDQTGNVTVTGNLVYNTLDEGIEIKIGTHDVIVDGNTFHNVNSGGNSYGGSGIEVNQAVGAVQHWDSNPNHIIRNNTVYIVGNGTGGAAQNSGIRVGTGASVYNNVIYGINTSGDGIFTDNNSNDSYPRNIYQNTIDVVSARAFINNGGTSNVKNNIGPTMTNNMATNSAYYANQAGANYHLVSGSAPVGAGINLNGAVSVDKDGVTRTNPPDLGAYQYVSSAQTRPQPPTNLKAIVN